MNGRNGYAVFFFPQALEALGEAIKPYLRDSPAGPHVPCDEIDTAGALIEMTLRGRTPAGADVVLEVMVPSSMVRMIVSTQNDGSFGFAPRSYGEAVPAIPQAAAAAPATGPATAGDDAGKPATP